MRKKLISIVATAAMAMSLMLMPMTVNATAGTNEAAIGSTEFATLQDAVNAAKPTDTVKLLDDVVLTDSAKGTCGIRVKDGKTLNLDMNGKNISGPLAPLMVYNGTLNITGTGVITETKTDNYAAIMVFGSSDESAQNYSNVTIGSSVTLVSGYAPIFVNRTDSSSNVWNVPNTGNKACGVNITVDGTLNSRNDDNLEGFDIYINGQIQNTTNYPIITLTKTAKLNAYGSHDIIYAAGYAQWNINGAALTSDAGVIELKAGKLNIKDGSTITSKATSTSHVANGDGASTTGYALALVENAGYSMPREITISGGAFTGAVAVVDDDSDISNNVGKLSITGGTFTVDPSKYVTDKIVYKTGSTYNVSGKVDAPAEPTVTPNTVATGVSDEAMEVVNKAASAAVTDILAGNSAGSVSKDVADAVKAAIDGGKDVSATVVASNIDVSKVNKTDMDEITKEVKKSAGTTKAATIVQYIDLGVQLKAGNDTLGNVTKLSEKVEFTIAVPSNVEASGRTFYVVRVHDGVATKLDTVLENGLLTFSTDKFSTYALVYEEAATVANPAGTVTQPKDTTGTTGTPATPGNTGSQTGTVKTGDATDMPLYLGMSLVAMIAALCLIFKKLRTDK